MSNLRGLFHKNSGNFRNNQRVLQAHNTKNLKVDAKGSPLYTCRKPSVYQSNIAAKRFSTQKSTSLNTPSPTGYANSRDSSFSNDPKRASHGRNSSEPQRDSIAEVSTLIEIILDRAHQMNNAGESSVLLAIAQVLYYNILPALSALF